MAFFTDIKKILKINMESQNSPDSQKYFLTLKIHIEAKKAPKSQAILSKMNNARWIINTRIQNIVQNHINKTRWYQHRHIDQVNKTVDSNNKYT